ncbi:MAG: phage holin family protein [Balneolaceae bacterium]
MLYTIFINSIAVFLGAYLLRGVEVKNYWTALGVAVILALVNTFIKPLIVFLTIPLTLLTLGLFILVINAWMLMLTDKFIEGFKVKGFFWAFIFSIVLSFLNAILYRIL